MDVEVQDAGATPSGRRRIVVVKNGGFSGPRLRDRVLPCGGDWLLERDQRLAAAGRAHHARDPRPRADLRLVPRHHPRLSSATDVSTHYFRTAPLFETAAEQYDWLNHILAVGYGRRAGDRSGTPCT